MPLKKKIKNYLLSNDINSFEQLIYHIEELKTNKDLSIDERDMLFKLVFCVCNKKDCLLSFFGENKDFWNMSFTQPILFEDKISKFKLLELKDSARLENDSLPYRKDCNSPKTNLSDKNFGKKETEGKLYYEISWEFIEEIAKRMASNKGDKYNLYNWKLPMTPKGIDDLKQAINRHHVEVMKGNYRDGDEVLGHIVAYANNAMMLWEQLREKDENK